MVIAEDEEVTRRHITVMDIHCVGGLIDQTRILGNILMEGYRKTFRSYKLKKG